MSRPLFTPTEAGDIVKEANAFRNDLVGPAAFFAGLTALQFSEPKQATAVATIALLFTVIWGFSRLPAYREAHARHYARFGTFVGWVMALLTNPMLFLGIAFLGAVAAEGVTPTSLEYFSLARLLR